MTKVPITQRDSWSLLPNGKPKNEPTPNAFSKDTFTQMCEEVEVEHMAEKPRPEPETIKELNLSYYTIIAISSGLLLIGIILGYFTTLAIYKDDIAIGNKAQNVEDKRAEIEWNNNQAKEYIKKTSELMPAYDTAIEEYGKSIIERMKPKTSKIINQ